MHDNAQTLAVLTSFFTFKFVQPSHVKCLSSCPIFLFASCLLQVSEARSLERDTVECGLTFAGFAVSIK